MKLLLLVSLCWLTACASQPARSPYNDPADQKSRAEQGHRELDKATKKFAE